MLKKALFLSFLFALAGAFALPAFMPGGNVFTAEAQSAENDRKTHEVQVRETLFSISRKYDVGVQDLRDWNDLDSDALRPGTVIYVAPPSERQPDTTPSEPETEPAPEVTPVADDESEQIIHTVEQGETLFSISRKYEVNVQQITEWNQLESTALRIGQELIVGRKDSAEESAPPATEPLAEEEAEQQEVERLELERTGPAYTFYTVRSGDTLTGIARAHGLSLQELRAMNDLRSDVLSIGQELVVGREQTAASVTGLEVESTAQGRFYTYEVSRNDSIEQLLEAHQMDATDFMALNPGLEPSDVRPGQRLVMLAPPTVSHPNPYRRTRTTAAAGNGEAIAATVYSDEERGRTTTSGDLYSPNSLTAAHPSISLGSVVYVENPESGTGVFVLINDRTTDTRLKLSRKAFEMLGLKDSAIPQVTIDSRLDS